MYMLDRNNTGRYRKEDDTNYSPEFVTIADLIALAALRTPNKGGTLFASESISHTSANNVL